MWATRISFLDVLSAVPPFLSHARKSKPAERRDRSQSPKIVWRCAADQTMLFYSFYIPFSDESVDHTIVSFPSLMFLIGL